MPRTLASAGHLLSVNPKILEQKHRFLHCVSNLSKNVVILQSSLVFFFWVIPLMFFLQNPCAHTLMFSCTKKMYKNSTSFLQSLVTKSCTGTFSAIY